MDTEKNICMKKAKEVHMTSKFQEMIKENPEMTVAELCDRIDKSFVFYTHNIEPPKEQSAQELLDEITNEKGGRKK